MGYVAGRLLVRYEGHAATVAEVRVTPDGKRVVSASADKTLRVWHMPG